MDDLNPCRIQLQGQMEMIALLLDLRNKVHLQRKDYKIDHVNKNCELGITIGEKSFWGKNHSHDALHICLNFLFHQLQMHCIYATVLSSNQRALKFFAKNNFENNGYLRDAVFRNGKFENLQFLSLINSDYK